MTPAQWEEVKECFHLALRQLTENRHAFLVAVCRTPAVLREVERLLAEHDRAGDFLARPALAGSPALLSKPFDTSDEFSGTPRFVVQERLGAGMFGIVYRVLDRERNSIVALKKLREFDAAHLLRFKREFRSLVDLVHPNLVQIYELFGQDRQWFFTMELVQGVDFLSYVRPGNVPADWDHLRDVLCQLTTGVQALHSSARLHRDLKPSNVLVSAEGRVSVLDFGLVKELDTQSIEQSFTFVGSPAYMAPEQASGGPITTAADWYAVGVMLYQAITGKLPFRGPWYDVLNRKQVEEAPLLRDLASDVPDDLNEVCARLLARTPELRPDGSAIIHLLRRPYTPAAWGASYEFVGRAAELELMYGHFSALLSGHRQVVLLHGRSGIGKTSLVSHFLTGIRRKYPDTVVLKGRCHESESVPYKALDSIADELVRYLRSLPESNAAELLPRHPTLLTRLFPVFGELEILATFQDRAGPWTEDQQIRSHAFEALRELLGRMSDRNAVVISIDDLQWGDLDSIAFLADLVLPAYSPVLMILLTFRSEDAASSPPLCLLREFEQRLGDRECWTDVELEGLPEQDGRDLLQRLRNDGPQIGEEQLRGLIGESHGSPLFLRELLRFVQDEAKVGEHGNPAPRVRLSEMIRRRTGSLSMIARELLEVLSVAGEPLSKRTLCHAVKTSSVSPSREIWQLIHENLVRVTGGADTGRLEPFHDQVREATLSSLSPSALQTWHRQLAEALEAEENPNPQKLLRHHLGAGNLAAAYQAALAAADIAERALAFDLAAGFYAEALATDRADVPDQAMLHRRRAEALSKAGRGRESAQCYLSATRWPEHNNVFDMRRLAAEQLLRSGCLDEGVQTFKDLLRSVGLWMPARPLESVLAMLALRAFIRVRGLRWHRRKEADVPGPMLRKLDLLWSGALALTGVNPVFGTYLQARHMLEALRAGEPFRLAISLGLGAGYEALGGAPYYSKGLKMLDIARNICEDLHNPYATALIYVFWSFLDQLCGRIEDGLEHCRKAAAGLREIGAGVSWESVTSNMLFTWFLGWGGRIRELEETVPRFLDDARSRGDVHANLVIRCFTTGHLVSLAADAPDRAIEETAQALEQWSRTQYDVPRFGAAYARVECELYAGRLQNARQLLLAEWPAIMSSLLFRKCQSFRIILFYMRGRTAMAAWLERRNALQLLHEAEHYASRLANIRSPWGNSMSDVLLAGISAGQGRASEAIALLDRAEATFRQQDLRLLAAAASRRHGELEGQSGSARIEAADAFMRSENILRPDRMASMILPGEWL